LVAKKLSGFEAGILVYDPYASSQYLGPAQSLRFCGLDELLTASDFVTIHARLTEESRGLINRNNIRLMKRTAYLINTSRAEIIDEQALREALENQWIAGVALDVFYREPPDSQNWLLGLDNVTLTPHMAGTTYDAYRNSVKLLGRRLLDHLESQCGA
jgi:D-3-phosphoglycerate dehydrogenase